MSFALLRRLHRRVAPSRAPRTRALRLLASAAAVLVLAACSGAQTAPTPPPERHAREFFPLHAQAAWSFDSTDMDHGGVPGLVTMQVVRDDGAGGYYIRQGQSSTPPALYEYVQGGVTRNGELILSDPIRPGSRWRSRSGDSYTIRNIGLTRTVPAGTFHNVIEVVRSAGDATLVDGTEYRETFFYAPGVGPIEGVVPILVSPGDARRFRLTLRGYTLDGQM